MAKKGRKGRSTRNDDGSPNPVDVHVGRRVRIRRLYLDMSQSKLARELGLTFQQIQKYERGLNRISASRLFDLSRILEVPVSFFFDDMPEGMTRDQPSRSLDLGTGVTDRSGMTDPMSHRETVELVRAYYQILDPGVRRRIYEMTKALAAEPESESDATGARSHPAPEVGETNGANDGC